MTDSPNQPRPLRCHHCGSADLALNEVLHEHARYEEGLYLDSNGAIRARGEGVFSPGDPQPQLMTIECNDCGRWWRPRRAFAGTEVTSA